ncbi:hypothetical protein EBR04_05445, partial [bacterium]|nr:hypothetical protein [bacterium]
MRGNRHFWRSNRSGFVPAGAPGNENSKASGPSDFTRPVIVPAFSLTRAMASAAVSIVPESSTAGLPCGADFHVKVDSAVIAPYLTGKYVIPGTTIQFTAPGATGYLGLDATFIAGTTTGLSLTNSQAYGTVATNSNHAGGFVGYIESYNAGRINFDGSSF